MTHERGLGNSPVSRLRNGAVSAIESRRRDASFTRASGAAMTGNVGRNAHRQQRTSPSVTRGQLSDRVGRQVLGCKALQPAVARGCLPVMDTDILDRRGRLARFVGATTIGLVVTLVLMNLISRVAASPNADPISQVSPILLGLGIFTVASTGAFAAITALKKRRSRSL